MPIRFEPFLHPALILVIVALFSFLIFGKYRRYQPVVSMRYWRSLLGAKIISLIILLVLLLNPYVVHKIPDTNELNVSFLVDATGSMTTSDVNGQSRIEFIKDSVLNSESAFYRQLISKFDHSHFFLFAGENLRRLQPGSEFNTLPGDTDIDPVLERVLTRPAHSRSLGAVVLISDGVDNTGVSLMAAAKKYKDTRIPIHCIGIGDPYPRPDLGVVWNNVPSESRKNEEVEFSATITRENSQATTVQAHLFENNRLIESRTITFENRSTTKNVKFKIIPFTSGFKTYKIQLDAIGGEENQMNNTDFTGIRVKDPDVFRALFFNANLDWDYKFLKIWADSEEKLTLDAVIRLSEQSYFVHGIKDGDYTADGLPECSILNQYDCLIINANSLYLLESEDVSCLMNFVENRGGGIIFTGLAETFQEDILRILPAAKLPIETTKLNKTDLVFLPSKVLMSDNPDELVELANTLFVPNNSEIYQIEPDEVKPGAMQVVSMSGPSWVILAVQYYGAGKTAYLNLSETWNWVMQLEKGQDYFGYFWGRLISWISSASKDRFSVHPGSTKLILTKEHEFSLDILDDHYNPDNNADIQCTVIGPSGEERAMAFIPDPKVDGRYKGRFIPRNAGEYRFYYKVKPSRGKELDRAYDYLVIDTSPESEPRPMAEGQLQSLARQTGGTYWNYKDLHTVNDLKLADNVSFIEEKRSLTEYWWFFTVALAAVLPDWILRRRIGLK